LDGGIWFVMAGKRRWEGLLFGACVFASAGVCEARWVAPRSAFAALSPEKINPKIKDMQYAVRGQLVINAMVRYAVSLRAVALAPCCKLMRPLADE
jgi:hypothetical protein